MESNPQAISQNPQASTFMSSPRLEHGIQSPRHTNQDQFLAPFQHQGWSQSSFSTRAPPTPLTTTAGQRPNLPSQEATHPVPHIFPSNRTEKKPPIPFAPLITRLIEEERLPSARKLLSLALL